MDLKLKYNDKSTGLVLGTAGLGGAWGAIDESESVAAILYALEHGVSRLDTAPAYANSERIVGEALSQWKGEKVFVSTKVGKKRGLADEGNLNDYSIPFMEQSIENSLEQLGKESLDLLFLHEAEKVPNDQIQEVVSFLQEVKKKGTVSQIGLGGWVTEGYHKAIRQDVFDVIMNFNNLDACNLSGLEFYIPFFKEHHVITYQGSALHMGLLGNRYKKYQMNPPEWLKIKDLENAEKANLLADKFNMTLPELAHRFLLSVHEVDYLVLGARNLQQLKDTLNHCQKGGLSRTAFYELVEAIL